MSLTVAVLPIMNGRSWNQTKGFDFDGSVIAPQKSTFSEAHFRRRCRLHDINLTRTKNAIVLEYRLVSMDLAQEQKRMRRKLQNLQVKKGDIERERHATRRHSVDTSRLEVPPQVFGRRKLSDDASSTGSDLAPGQAKAAAPSSKTAGASSGGARHSEYKDPPPPSPRKSSTNSTPRRRLSSEESSSVHSAKSDESSQPTKLPEIDLLTRAKVQPVVQKWKSLAKKKGSAATFITDNSGHDGVCLSLARRNSLQHPVSTGFANTEGDDQPLDAAPQDIAAVAPKPRYQRTNSLASAKQGGMSNWLGMNDKTLKTTRRKSVSSVASAPAQDEKDKKKISFAALVDTVMAMKASGIIKDV